MATITFNGISYTVDHAVKGPDYVHGYAADGTPVFCIEGITDFSVVTYDGTYMSPDDCATEGCNNVMQVAGELQTADGDPVTAAVGNANKLGGKGASEYFTKSGGEIDGSIKASGAEFGELSVVKNGTGGSYTKHVNDNGILGYLGYNADSDVVAMTGAGNTRYLLHDGNVGDYAVTKNGIGIQEISSASYAPFGIHNTYEGSTGVVMNFSLRGTYQGSFGFNDGNAIVSAKGATHNLHHDGNSAKVVVSSTPLTAEGSVRVW